MGADKVQNALRTMLPPRHKYIIEMRDFWPFNRRVEILAEKLTITVTGSLFLTISTADNTHAAFAAGHWRAIYPVEALDSVK